MEIARKFSYDGQNLFPGPGPRGPHPLSKDWVSAIMAEAEKNGGKIDWVNCGLCVDEHGLGNEALVEGIKRVPRAEVPKLMSDFDHVWAW